MINYDIIADIYDLDMGANIGSQDLPFYLQYAREYRPVLELGCGTGRIMSPFAAEGIFTVGIDNSLKMLDAAKSKLGASPATPYTLVCADMAAFEFKIRFGLAICAFSTFSKLITHRQQNGFLDCVYRHLRPGGVLLIDMFVQKPEFARIPDGKCMLDYEGRYAPKLGCWVSRYKRIWKDHHPGVNKIELEYRLTGADGTTQVRRLTDFTRYCNPQELKSMLQAAGFDVRHVYEDYQKQPFSSNGAQMIFEARRGR